VYSAPEFDACVDITAEAGSPAGQTVSWALEDSGFSGTEVIACDSLSGSQFALGDTDGTCTLTHDIASSLSGADCTFTVTVEDTTAPEYAYCPDDVLVDVLATDSAARLDIALAPRAWGYTSKSKWPVTQLPCAVVPSADHFCQPSLH
jgi:hypothetical protein